jgi:hypothetical protein
MLLVALLSLIFSKFSFICFGLSLKYCMIIFHLVSFSTKSVSQSPDCRPNVTHLLCHNLLSGWLHLNFSQCLSVTWNCYNVRVIQIFLSLSYSIIFCQYNFIVLSLSFKCFGQFFILLCILGWSHFHRAQMVLIYYESSRSLVTTQLYSLSITFYCCNVKTLSVCRPS